jgi:lysophospholipase L1-like esterase
MMRALLGKILLVLVSIVFTLLAGEVFLRFTKPQIFEVHPKGMYMPDPDVGYVLAAGFEGFMIRSEFQAHFSTNQSGLRGPELRPRESNTFRILILGDSQAWGFGVRDNETFSYQLESMLASHYPKLDIQVLNAGVPGYGTADQLAFLESRGLALKPDIVIVQFLSVNDIKESRSPAYLWADVKGGMLVSKVRSGDEQSQPILLGAKRWLKSNSHLARLVFDRLGYLMIRAGFLGRVDQLWGEDFSEEDAKRTVKLLVKIAQASRDMGAKSLFLYTTGQAHVIDSDNRSLRSMAIVEFAANKANVPWIHITEHFRRRVDKVKLYYPKNGHWTSVGHQAVAQILFTQIGDLGLI